MCSDQLSKCLTSDFFDKDHLEPKDVYEIPAYYLSMMLKSELQVKTEENQENHEVWFIRNWQTVSCEIKFAHSQFSNWDQ